MNMRRYGGLSMIALTCAVGSYLATYAVQQQGRAGRADDSIAVAQSVTDWLEMTPRQAAAVRDIEAPFAADRALLEASLVAEREHLATMLENPAARDDEILRQVEKVIAAHNALERRVAEFLVAMRPHLSATQQKRLFDRLASTVREGGGWRWRHGRPGSVEGGWHGGGPPPGRGPARGRGPDGGLGERGHRGEPTATGPSPQPQQVPP